MSNYCEECKAEKNKKANNTVPYIVYEAEMARAERTSRRLCIALVASVVALLLSNIIYFLA